MDRAKKLSKYTGKTMFLLGDEAAAYGALYAGCTFFGGYPITPATEIAEVMARELPKVGGNFVQFEDEIASIGSIIGAAWAGGRSMTATSGPGFSLMQENIGYAMMTETPCVIVDVQRSGPSTGQATKPGQGDLMQARWGTHGDHEAVALSPWSVQECFDLMIDAFDISEKLRTPVIFLMDGEIGHLRERITFPDPADVEVTERRLGCSDDLMFGCDEVPPMAEFGQGTFVHVTGSTHKENGVRDVQSEDVHDVLARRLYSKIEGNRKMLEYVHVDGLEDADVVVVSWGASARPSFGAVLEARKLGLKVGFIRPLVVWPFPKRFIEELDCKGIVVAEQNLGQMVREVERYTNIPITKVNRIGGVMLTVEQIFEGIKEASK